MNETLPIYYSKANLTTRFADYSNVYVLPSICAFGIVTSILCIIVSAKRDESNAKSLDYILLNSLIDFLFLLTQFFLFIIRCGDLCPFGYTYAAKFYEIYIFLYFGYVLVSSQVFLSIYISYDRLSLFSGKAYTQKKMSLYRVYFVCFVISGLVNAPPYLIAREVVALGIFIPTPNTTSYEILYIRTIRAEFQTLIANYLLTILMAIKDPIMFTVLTGLSIWICVKFRIYLKSKKMLIKKIISSKSFFNYFIYDLKYRLLNFLAEQSMTFTTSLNSNETQKRNQSAEKKESNFTLLTLLYCLIYIIGNFIDCFSMIASLLSFDIYVKYGFINICGNILFFASHGVHLFVYYYFNNVFRKKFNEFWNQFRRR